MYYQYVFKSTVRTQNDRDYVLNRMIKFYKYLTLLNAIVHNFQSSMY